MFTRKQTCPWKWRFVFWGDSHLSTIIHQVCWSMLCNPHPVAIVHLIKNFFVVTQAIRAQKGPKSYSHVESNGQLKLKNSVQYVYVCLANFYPSWYLSSVINCLSREFSLPIFKIANLPKEEQMSDVLHAGKKVQKAHGIKHEHGIYQGSDTTSRRCEWLCWYVMLTTSERTTLCNFRFGLVT